MIDHQTEVLIAGAQRVLAAAPADGQEQWTAWKGAVEAVLSSLSQALGDAEPVSIESARHLMGLAPRGGPEPWMSWRRQVGEWVDQLVAAVPETEQPKPYRVEPGADGWGIWLGEERVARRRFEFEATLVARSLALRERRPLEIHGVDGTVRRFRIVLPGPGGDPFAAELVAVASSG